MKSSLFYRPIWTLPHRRILLLLLLWLRRYLAPLLLLPLAAAVAVAAASSSSFPPGPPPVPRLVSGTTLLSVAAAASGAPAGPRPAVITFAAAVAPPPPAGSGGGNSAAAAAGGPCCSFSAAGQYGTTATAAALPLSGYRCTAVATTSSGHSLIAPLSHTRCPSAVAAVGAQGPAIFQGHHLSHLLLNLSASYHPPTVAANVLFSCLREDASGSFSSSSLPLSGSTTTTTTTITTTTDGRRLATATHVTDAATTTTATATNNTAVKKPSLYLSLHRYPFGISWPWCCCTQAAVCCYSCCFISRYSRAADTRRRKSSSLYSGRNVCFWASRTSLLCFVTAAPFLACSAVCPSAVCRSNTSFSTAPHSSASVTEILKHYAVSQQRHSHLHSASCLPPTHRFYTNANICPSSSSLFSLLSSHSSIDAPPASPCTLPFPRSVGFLSPLVCSLSLYFPTLLQSSTYAYAGKGAGAARLISHTERNSMLVCSILSPGGRKAATTAADATATLRAAAAMGNISVNVPTAASSYSAGMASGVFTTEKQKKRQGAFTTAPAGCWLHSIDTDNAESHSTATDPGTFASPASVRWGSSAAAAASNNKSCSAANPTMSSKALAATAPTKQNDADNSFAAADTSTREPLNTASAVMSMQDSDSGSSFLSIPIGEDIFNAPPSFSSLLCQASKQPSSTFCSGPIPGVSSSLSRTSDNTASQPFKEAYSCVEIPMQTPEERSLLQRLHAQDRGSLRNGIESKLQHRHSVNSRETDEQKSLAHTEALWGQKRTMQADRQALRCGKDTEKTIDRDEKQQRKERERRKEQDTRVDSLTKAHMFVREGVEKARRSASRIKAEGLNRENEIKGPVAGVIDDGEGYNGRYNEEESAESTGSDSSCNTKKEDTNHGTVYARHVYSSGAPLGGEQQREAVAVARYVRLSPIKTRRVLHEIRGLSLGAALAHLVTSPRRPALAIFRVLQSALANAIHAVQLQQQQSGSTQSALVRLQAQQQQQGSVGLQSGWAGKLLRPRIKEITANNGPVMKRPFFRARGKMDVRRRPTTHIRVVLLY